MRAAERSSACPDDATLVALLAGQLGEVERRSLHAHVDACGRCRQLLVGLAQIGPTPVGGADATVASVSREAAQPLQVHALVRGTKVGHFEVLEELGQGGMGTVYAASDALLGRRIALKLVRTRARGGDDGHARRLVREAQAMAAVSHPNVVTVHEVGTFGSEVFLAMELADGGTLADWLASGAHPWAEITRRFIAAGRGLAAAHDAGLVHRDFKPQNVLLTTSGRVCVSDFGLVQVAATTTTVAPDELADTSESQWSATLTATGTVVGTPRYMAREQLRGGVIDMRTDQFSFCVALYEALYGKHPFGDGPSEWMVGVIDGKVREPSDRRGTPTRIHRALLRGLAQDPAARFPSMGALLDELDGTLRMRRTIGLAAIGGTLATLAVGLGFLAGRPLHEPVCERPAFAGFGASWRAEDRRAAIATATSTGPLGDQTWPLVAARLDAYVDDGERLRSDTCDGVDALTGTERTLAERRLECLASRDAVLDVITELLASGDQIGGAEALDAIDGLLPIDACRELSTRASVPVPPASDIAEDVRALRRRVTAASALAWAGHPEPAITALDPLLAEAEALGYEPLVAETHYALGVASRSTDERRSERHLRAAQTRALQVGDDLGVIAALRVLADELAERGEDQDTAELLLDEAEAWRARLGLPDDAAQYLERSTLARTRGDLHEAIALATRAVELADRPGTSAQLRSTVHGNLGAMLAEQLDAAGAREHTAKALEIAEAAYGRDHRRALWYRTNLAGLALRMNDYAEAKRLASEVLATAEATGMAELPEAAITLTMLGYVARTQGEPATALVHDRRALAIRKRVFGDVHPLVAESMEKIALDELNAGNARAAVEQLRAVVELDRRLHPADHPSIGLTQVQLANALRESGDTNAAAREADDAIAQLGKTIASDDVRMWGPWYAAGKAALAAEHFARARECLQHARDLGTAAALTPWDWSELDFLFARALAEGDRTNAAARALASSARARLRPSDPTDAALLREIDGWLADG